MTSEEQGALDFDSAPSASSPENEFERKLQLERPLVFYDLETTGLDFQNDRIVQFAFIKVHPNGQEEEWDELVNPGIPIPEESTKIHGITDKMVKDKQKFNHFAPIIHDYLKNCDLAGYNAIRFDVPFLQAEMTRCENKLNLEKVKFVDPQIIFHKKEPRDLAGAYRFYCKEELVGAHNAMADIRATLNVFKAQMSHYDDLPNRVDQLHAFCNEKNDRFVTSDRRFYWRSGEAVLAFGKHKSKSLKWLREKDPNYLFWIMNGEFSEETKEVVRKAINGVFPEKPKEKE